MPKTRLMPASISALFLAAILTGLYFNGSADAASDEEPASDRGQETYLERAARTRAGELIQRVNDENIQECTC